jgi:Mrp family chromosome partitioning ATPase
MRRVGDDTLDTAVTAREYIRILRQHVVLILVVTFVTAGASYLFATRETPAYQAVAQVVLGYEDIPSLLTNAQNPATAVQPDRNATTQAQLARTPAVARRALAAAGVRDMEPSDLLNQSSVTSDPASDLLSFGVTANRPQLAERLATSYAAAYVSYSYAQLRAPLNVAIDRLTSRLERLRRLGAAGSPLYIELRTRLDQLESLRVVQNPASRVVRPASSAQQTQPRIARALVVGVPVGLLLGVVLALLLHVSDSRVRSTTSIEQLLAAPSLGRIPMPPRRNRHRAAALSQDDDAYEDALASVRTNLDLERREHGGEVVVVTTVASRAPGVKSATTANLAVSFARAGFQVVLVDTDLRHPAVGSLFALEPHLGLTEILLGQAQIHDVLVPISVEHTQPKRKRATVGIGHLEFGGSLRLVPVAALPANPTDVIAAPRLGAIFEQLRTEADLILVDAPPLLEGSAVAALSPHADSIALVVHLGHDRRSDLTEARRRLHSIPLPVLGCVGVGRARAPAAEPLVALQPSRAERVR